MLAYDAPKAYNFCFNALITGKRLKIGVSKSFTRSSLHSATGCLASTVPGFDVFFDYANMMSPLGNASAEDCAAYITIMFSDFTRMVTMQNLMHDGGFSTSGITEDLIEKLSK